MDATTETTNQPANEGGSNSTKAKKAAGSKGSAKVPGKGKKAKPEALTAPQYAIRTTVVRKNVAVGNQVLARLFERNWNQIHMAVYYVTVFAPSAIGGRIVGAADAGLREYLQERVEAAERMLDKAQTRAQEAAIEMGAPGKISEHSVELASQVETQVLKMIRAYDDYLVVMDSLWIGNELIDSEHEAAHKLVRDDITAMVKLMNKLRSRLINFRRERTLGKLSKPEQTQITEVEDLIIASLSEEAAKQRLQARERAEEKARKRAEQEAAAAKVDAKQQVEATPGSTQALQAKALESVAMEAAA